MYRKTVTIRKEGKLETLNLVYEPEIWEGTDVEFTTDSDDEIDII